MKQEGSDYFMSRSKEEEYPIKIDKESSIKCYNLEKIFEHFFPDDSLSIAKSKSLEERDNKHIKDSSFTYGEVVIIFILFFLIFFNQFRLFVLWHIYMNILK